MVEYFLWPKQGMYPRDTCNADAVKKRRTKAQKKGGDRNPTESTRNACTLVRRPCVGWKHFFELKHYPIALGGFRSIGALVLDMTFTAQFFSEGQRTGMVGNGLEKLFAALRILKTLSAEEDMFAGFEKDA